MKTVQHYIMGSPWQRQEACWIRIYLMTLTTLTPDVYPMMSLLHNAGQQWLEINQASTDPTDVNNHINLLMQLLGLNACTMSMHFCTNICQPLKQLRFLQPE